MGIYIKGMEMPTSCHECLLCIGGYCPTPICPAEEDGICPNHGRPDWCPLIPVPPHGRLIDADALMLRVNMHGTNKFGMLDEDIRQFVDAAPTIIEAEEEEQCR